MTKTLWQLKLKRSYCQYVGDWLTLARIGNDFCSWLAQAAAAVIGKVVRNDVIALQHDYVQFLVSLQQQLLNRIIKVFVKDCMIAIVMTRSCRDRSIG